MSKSGKMSPTLKVHKTPEQRSGLVDKLIDAGYEVLQTKKGITIGVSQGEGKNALTFSLGSQAVGSQGFADIALQARRAEQVFASLASLLETPVEAATDRSDSSITDLS